MTTPREELTRMIDELRTQRDLLRVQLHLAGVEAHDEWEALEKRWEHLRARAAVVGHEAKETAESVGSALAQVADEIKDGYERLRALI